MMNQQQPKYWWWKTATTKKRKSRPSTAKQGWKKALSTSMSGRPMSASNRKKWQSKWKRNEELLRQRYLEALAQ